uniref:uncharacterized protein LOC131126201 n=1 Tax=Doryrhamphus excisus TaxID=161450 RepID=UPI0025ADF5C8|nr:uncharacterized protein LOC131126201 [Doryrhamphus excisus]
MKRQLFLLALAVVCDCQALNITDEQTNMTSEAPTTSAPALRKTTLVTLSAQNHTSNQTAQVLTSATTGGDIMMSDYNDNDQNTTRQAEGMPEVSTMAPIGSTVAVSDESLHPSSWGYVLLVLLLLVILSLLVILYLLRRANRTYSFDLHRAAPVNHTDEPSGTFEVICLDEQDREPTSDLSVSPAVNGSVPQSQEEAPEPDVNHLKVLDFSDSNSTIRDDAVETAANCELLLDTSEKNMSPFAFTNSLAGIELSESLPIKQNITPAVSSSSSSSY